MKAIPRQEVLPPERGSWKMGMKNNTILLRKGRRAVHSEYCSKANGWPLKRTIKIVQAIGLPLRTITQAIGLPSTAITLIQATGLPSTAIKQIQAIGLPLTAINAHKKLPSNKQPAPLPLQNPNIIQTTHTIGVTLINIIKSITNVKYRATTNKFYPENIKLVKKINYENNTRYNKTLLAKRSYSYGNQISRQFKPTNQERATKGLLPDWSTISRLPKTKKPNNTRKRQTKKKRTTKSQKITAMLIFHNKTKLTKHSPSSSSKAMRTLAQFIFGSQKTRIKPTPEGSHNINTFKEKRNMPKQAVKETGQSTIEEYYVSQPKPTDQEHIDLESQGSTEEPPPPTTPSGSEKRSLSRGNSDGRNPKKPDNRKSSDKILTQSTPSKEGKQNKYTLTMNAKYMIRKITDDIMMSLDAYENRVKRRYKVSQKYKNNRKILSGDFSQYRDTKDFDESLGGNLSISQQAFEDSLREAAADNGKENVQPDLNFSSPDNNYRIPKKNTPNTTNQEHNNAQDDLPSEEEAECSFEFIDPDAEEQTRPTTKVNSWSKFIKVGCHKFNDQHDMTQPLYEQIKKFLDKKAEEEAKKDGDTDKKGSKWVIYHHGEILDFKEPDGTIAIRHIYMNCRNEEQFDWNMTQLKKIQKKLQSDESGKQIFLWGQGVADKTYMCTFTIRDSRWCQNKKESNKAHEKRVLPQIMGLMNLSEYINDIKLRGIHSLKEGNKQDREPIVKGIKIRANVYGKLAEKILAWQEPPREVVTCGHVRVSYFIQTQSIVE